MNTEKIISNVLKNFNYKNQLLDLFNDNYIPDVKISKDVLNCIVNINEQNRDYIIDLTKAVKEKILNVSQVKQVNFAFTGLKLNEKIKISGVKKVLLISSGKGGVGKSTLSFLLGLKLLNSNIKVGIVDADIYGPSLPTLTNIYNQPEIINSFMIPHKFKGLELNSIGYLIPKDQALIWRGPMIVKAIHQLLGATKWNDLDLLIIDMPPGTGDIHLTIVQKYQIDGVIMIVTPDNLAIADFARAVNMYLNLGLDILGVIENMNCFETVEGTKYNLFSNNDELQQYCIKNNLSILSHIPLCQNHDNISKYINTELVSKIINALHPNI